MGAVFVRGEVERAFTESDEALMRLFKLQADVRGPGSLGVLGAN
jgi:hypothetical protein